MTIWSGTPQLTPRQRDVQAAHHHGFWQGFRRGWIVGGAIGYPPFIAFLVWWYCT